MRDDAGALVATLPMTLDGGLFSLDGAHPGPFGHAAATQRFVERLRAFAAARASGSFGGLHGSEMQLLSKSVLDGIKTKDPVLGRSGRE